MLKAIQKFYLSVGIFIVAVFCLSFIYDCLNYTFEVIKVKTYKGEWIVSEVWDEGYQSDKITYAMIPEGLCKAEKSYGIQYELYPDYRCEFITYDTGSPYLNQRDRRDLANAEFKRTTELKIPENVEKFSPVFPINCQLNWIVLFLIVPYLFFGFFITPFYVKWLTS